MKPRPCMFMSKRSSTAACTCTWNRSPPLCGPPHCQCIGCINQPPCIAQRCFVSALLLRLRKGGGQKQQSEEWWENQDSEKSAPSLPGLTGITNMKICTIRNTDACILDISRQMSLQSKMGALFISSRPYRITLMGQRAISISWLIGPAPSLLAPSAH